MQVESLLAHMVQTNASDAFITVHSPPAFKIDGAMQYIKGNSITEDEAREMVLSTMSDAQQAEFLRHNECQYAIRSEKYGRFRVSAFVQRGNSGMVIRRINSIIPKIEELGLPEIVRELSMVKRGLVIFVGGTGTGKSTSLAAMVGYRNQNSKGHIISIEDPIEFVHEHGGCIVTQREVGIDTESFEIALQNTLRQAPDVILIGEVRTAQTMSQAITFAETGHLCLCTLHANNANQALDRILSFFPVEQHAQVLMDVSLNLKAMVAQQLLPKKDGKGRVPVMEVLLNSPLIADHIRNGKVHLIKEVMTKSTESGMQTLDQSLVKAYAQGLITSEEAIRCADSQNDVRLAIKMHNKKQMSFTGQMSVEEGDAR